MARRTVLAGVGGLAITGCHGARGGRLAARAPGPRAPNLAADVVVYGATPAGVIAALEVAAHGLRVVIVGGWRERQVGGMMSGGLGYTDYLDIDAFGGRPRAAIEAIRDGRAPGNPYAFKPSRALAYFEDQLARAAIPVFWSQGVEAVELDPASRRLRRLATVDGLRAAARVFIDASYEGDLMARAGAPFRTGREAADACNRINGYRGLVTDHASGSHQFALRGRPLHVDPFVKPGDPASGLLPGVKVMPERPVGGADDAIQAYNFRLTMTDRPELRQDLPAAPPDGYDRADYEPLFRYVEAIGRAGLRYGADWSFKDDLILANDLGDGVYDVNAYGGFSTDPFGLSWGYPDADYAERERIWKAHERYTRGFLYALAWERDPRLPAGLQAEVRHWGLLRGAYAQPGLLDAPGWPPQLYVREARRLDGEATWTGADLEAPDSEPPRSPRIVAMASYREDSHHVQRLAAPAPAGGWRLWNEGNVEAAIGGDDHWAPIPLEVTLPRRDSCTNLFVPFCASATHQAFSAIRMELSAMALGQACGAAAAVLCAGASQPDAQDVDYPALKHVLLSSGAVVATRTGLDAAMHRVERSAFKRIRMLGRRMHA